MLNDKERQQRAVEVLQSALHSIAQQLGISVEVALQVENISDTYAASRATWVLRPIPGWHPSEDMTEKH